jgi:threonine/homoserine/homoserine lactone efflux protein
MVMRTRRAIPRKWLIVVISVVGGVVLIWIGWLSI